MPKRFVYGCVTVYLVYLISFIVAGFAGTPIVIAAESEKETAAARPGPPSMTAEEIQTFLAQPLVASLAVVRANKTPQLTPMWFIYENGMMYMSTRTYAAKVKHIRANPNVSVVVETMDAPLKNTVVTLEGKAQVLETEVKPVVEKIYRKYMGEEGMQTPAAERNINTPRVILKITPKRVRSMDTTK